MHIYIYTYIHVYTHVSTDPYMYINMVFLSHQHINTETLQPEGHESDVSLVTGASHCNTLQHTALTQKLAPRTRARPLESVDQVQILSVLQFVAVCCSVLHCVACFAAAVEIGGSGTNTQYVAVCYIEL